MNIDKYFNKGYKHRNWYDKTNQSLKDHFPKENISTLSDMLAVTSMNATLKSNVSQFIKALYQYKNDLPFDGYLPAISNHLGLIRDKKPLTGRKVRNFGNAIKGESDAVVVDLWMLRAFEMDKPTPSKKDYDFIEKYIKQKGHKHGIEPRKYQASVWCGIRGNNKQPDYCSIIESKFQKDFFITNRKYTKKQVYIN